MSSERLSWPRILLLYAVLLHRIYNTNNFPRKIRILRNLVEASNNELRADKIAKILSDTRDLIIQDNTSEILSNIKSGSLNLVQVDNEIQKMNFLKAHPELENILFYLEDHDLLRGSLMAFELDALVFEDRAKAFYKVFSKNLLPNLTGALLASGNYMRQYKKRFYRFGSSISLDQWRTNNVLVGAHLQHLKPMRDALGHLLDFVTKYNGETKSALIQYQNNWLKEKEASGFDWRWYFVKYHEMRVGKSGLY